jgi:LPXTG-motif cell wall-anchored protein
VTASGIATAAVLVAVGAPVLAALALILHRRRRWSLDVRVHRDDGRHRDDTP